MSGQLPTARLDELVDLQTEKVVTNKDPELPYVGLEHIAQGEPRLLGWQESVASTSTNNAFQQDDILFGKLRPNLRKSVRAPFEGYCSTDILVLRPRRGVCPSFAGHVFQSVPVFAAAVATAAGTKMPRTSWQDLRGLRVFTPTSEPAQRRIAAVLDTVDEAIAKTEAVIAKLRQVRAGLLHDLLTRGLDENGELRDPVARPEEFWDSPVGRIPRGWEVESLGARLHKNDGWVQTGPFGTQLHAHEYADEGVPVVMPQDIADGGFSTALIARIPRGKAHELRRHQLRPGDLVFARRGDLARCAAVTTLQTGWLCGTGCLLMRFRPRTLLSEWLSLAYRHDIGQRQMAARAVGTTMVNLNTGLLMDLVFAFPSIGEQAKVVEALAAIAARVNADTEGLGKLRLLKSGLLSDLLTGRVRVPEGVGAVEVRL